MDDVLIGIDVGKTHLRVASWTPGLAPLTRWSASAAEPQYAVKRLLDHLRALQQTATIRALGLSTFGPLDADPASPSFGSIAGSSAPSWTGVNLPHALRSLLRAPLFFDYDVNAGALAESRLGAGLGLDSFVYLSIGTGISAVPYRHGLTPGFAPQLGHMMIPREPDDTTFAGNCRFHADCLQGLASGSALAARWGRPAEDLEPTHPAWNLEARYLARACTNLVYTFAPDAILLASSVALVPGLVAATNIYLASLLNGFLDPTTLALYASRPPIRQAACVPDSSLLGAAVMAAEGLGLRYP